MALLVTRRLVLMLVLSFMALDTTQGQDCPFSEVMKKCHPHFQRYVGWSFDVLRLSDADFPALCRPFLDEDVEGCHGETISCNRPFEFNGVVPAYKFICDKWDSTTDSAYASQYRVCFNDVPKLQSCFVMYPQAMPMGAKHILNKAENCLDLIHSQPNDRAYYIYNYICIHLTTSRDIFCSESVVRAKCGKAAGEWHSTLIKTLFNITPGSLPKNIEYRRGLPNSLNIANCPRSNAKETSACELSKKCVPILNNFAMNVRFGVFTFTETDLNSFCGFSDEDLQTCVSQVVSHCSFIDLLIFNASIMVHKKLCSDQYKTQYLLHRECLTSSVSETSFSTVLGCTDELMKSYKSAFLSKSDERGVETTLCKAAAAYLICLEEKLTVICKADAAQWQRKMTRFMIVQAFQLTYCTTVFDFEDMEKSVQGEGPALKANELNTALLVAAVTVFACCHYIKCLYYV